MYLTSLQFKGLNISQVRVHYHSDVCLQYLCQTRHDVNEKVRNAMGDVLYERFMVSTYAT